MAAQTISTVDFHGTPLTVITTKDGQHLVAMKPICDAIGLQWEAQYKRIMRNQVLNEGMSMMDIPSNGGVQKAACLPIDYPNGWLFGVDVARCREDIRPRLIEYQRECYRALADYWLKGEAKNARAEQGGYTLTEYDANNLSGIFTLAALLRDTLKEIEPPLRALRAPIAPRVVGCCDEIGLFLTALRPLRQYCDASYRKMTRRVDRMLAVH